MGRMGHGYGSEWQLGGQISGADCPPSEADWQQTLAAQDAHIGLTAAPPMREHAHKLFLPAITNLYKLDDGKTDSET